MLKQNNSLPVTRYKNNPILSPQEENDWEASAVFNPSVVKDDTGLYHFLYRALSTDINYEGQNLKLSTIGYGKSKNGFEIKDRRQFIVPEYAWEKFGCEDPRVTKLEDSYYIFYTALSEYPPVADGIRVGLAITQDFKTVTHKHLVTHFNAKAMALFPEKINGQYVAILTANTDRPPAKIAIARFNNLKDLWSPGFWEKWYQNIEKYEINISRIDSDHIEVGGVPVKTKNGWLLTYAHIQNYFTPDKRVFGIETVLLDLNDPQQIVARTQSPLLTPQADYELNGLISKVIFPSSALIENNNLRIYYGAADTHCAVAEVNFSELEKKMRSHPFKESFYLTKYHDNPILTPRTENFWEANSVFNPAAVYENKKFYVVYRAQSPDNTSTLGLAESDDGLHFTRHHEPIYVPRKEFEQKREPGRLSGCEDPRITKLGDEFFMFYTAYDGINPPRVALSSIAVKDFINHNWQWSEPKVISSPDIDNKNSCLLPEKVNNKYVILHRMAGRDIAIDYLDSLEELQQKDVWLEKEQFIEPRENWWDGQKIGIAGPPLKVDPDWLLLYHGVSDIDHHYRVGFMLLDRDNLGNVLYRTPYPILKPTEEFEKIGDVNNVVFPCGAVIVKGTLFVYYGGADKVVCVATANLNELLAQIKI